MDFLYNVAGYHSTRFAYVSRCLFFLACSNAAGGLAHMPAQGHRKPAHTRRDKQMTFWVTAAERDRIRENAERAGMSPSAFVRALALGKTVTAKPQGEVRELIRQLNRIGNNLNQLLRHAHTMGEVAEDCISHVYKRVDAALAQWATGSVSIALTSDMIARLAHAGAEINRLARLVNSRKPVPPAMLLTALQDLTEKLLPVMR